MSSGLIVFTGVIYAYVAFDQYTKGNTGLAIAYIGYAFSNMGLAYAAK